MIEVLWDLVLLLGFEAHVFRKARVLPASRGPALSIGEAHSVAGDP